MNRLLKHLFSDHPVFPHARRRCDLVIISAVSDGEWLGVHDLLDSFITYLDCNYAVVVADDATTDGTYARLLDTDCWVVRNPQKLHLSGVDLTLRRAFLEAHRLFDAPIYLKMDPDALVIGTGLLNVLRSAFSTDPKTGLLGTYHLDWNGKKRDLSYSRDRMIRRRKDLGMPYNMAVRNGYQLGDGVQGGTYAVSHNCLDTIIRRGWFHGKQGYRPSGVKGEHVDEDSLIAMLTYAAGFKAQDIGGPGQPFGIWDIGLPMPLEELVRQNRLVTHAMKYNDEASLQARDFFRVRRDTFRFNQPL
ncbi:MAG: hypothetical protein ABL892_08595 [Thiobacillaceae bacterium]